MKSDSDKIQRLWDDLADFPATATDQALLHLLRTLSGWIGADNAVWSGGIRILRGAAARRDTQRGWRIPVQCSLFPRGEARERLAAPFRSVKNGFDPGMAVRALMARTGHLRIHRLRDGFIDFEAFRKTSYYDTYYARLGITDRLWAVVPLHEEAEAGFVFERHWGQRRRFTQRHADLVGATLRGRKSFLRQVYLSYGIEAGGVPLSPTLCRIARKLLTGGTEKEIAGELRLRPSTLHQYVKEIYRHFGVRSRADLMSLWLGSTPVGEKEP